MKQMVFYVSVLLFAACNKKNNTPDPVIPPADTTTKPATDPAIANTIGFFLDDWTQRNFTVPPYEDVPKPAETATALITVDASNIITKVPKFIAGQNSNIWMSQMITEASLMNHLTNLRPNVIRFPGGSISDVFFWYAQNTESWTFSVDNYYNILQQTGNQGLITINYGYARYGTGSNPVAAAAHLAADWVRYDNGRTKYWEIGNECNGTWEAGYRIKTSDNKDGQPEIITGTVYGQHVKVFMDSM